MTVKSDDEFIMMKRSTFFAIWHNHIPGGKILKGGVP
jgi:hypothetical protein